MRERLSRRLFLALAGSAALAPRAARGAGGEDSRGGDPVLDVRREFALVAARGRRLWLDPWRGRALEDADGRRLELAPHATRVLGVG